MKTSRIVYFSGALGKQQTQPVNPSRAVKVVYVIRLGSVM